VSGRQESGGADRLPPIARVDWTEEQRRSAKELVCGARGALLPPFESLLRSPELMTHVQRTGEYLRYRSAIGKRLSELAILVTARQWSQPVEWAIHAPIAVNVGVDERIVDSIARGRRPTLMSDDEAAVHDFCVELHRDKAVSDTTWRRAIERLGEKGVVDLIGINGHHAMLSMVMNAARTPVPEATPATRPPVTA